MNKENFRGLLWSAVTVFILGVIFLLKVHPVSSPPANVIASAVLNENTKPKVLFVDSYHKGYLWSEGILAGVLKVLNGTLQETDTVDCSQSPVNLRIVRMNTKRNQTEAFMEQAGNDARAIIETWKPDIVITSDDNAARYVIVPYYLNSELPFVFCGINWDAGAYGFPCRNVTGMLEVDLVDTMLNTMRQYARGPRIGVLGADNISNRKAADHYVNTLHLTLTENVFVTNLSDMKTAYLDLQEKVDMLILMPPSFIDSESDAAEAKQFILDHTQIITGSVESWIAPYTLFCFGKSADELGMWAASTALTILDGTPPTTIPLTQNQQAEMYLNMPLAKHLNLLFPVDMIEQSNIIME